MGLSFGAYAQNYLFDLQSLNVENGLPDRTTFDVTQDKDGYIWTSNRGKISRYDGHKFRTYNADFLNIGEGNPVFMAADPNNLIWYCESKIFKHTNFSGVLDARKDSIYRLENFTNGLINSQEVSYISQSRLNKSTIFITTKSGIIYKYDGRFQIVYRFPHNLEGLAICEQSLDGGHWILYENKVLKIKDERQIGQTILLPFEPDYRVAFRRIVAQEPNLIIESQSIYGLKLRKYWELKNGRLVPFQISDTNIESFLILQKSKNFLLYAQDGGIHAQDSSGKLIYSHKITQKPLSLFFYGRPYIDDQRILWVPSMDGLYKIVTKRNPFKILQSDQSIRGIYKYNNDLYIGSYTENRVFDLKKNESHKFLKDRVAVATSFQKDDNGNLWIGNTNNFLYQYEPKNNQWNEYRMENFTRPYVVFRNPVTQRLLLGTNSGLAYFDENLKKNVPISLPLSNNEIEIRDFHYNRKGIWIISNQGLFLMDPSSESIKRHYSKSKRFPSNNLMHLYEDGKGVFWIATKDQGLIAWKFEENTFNTYTTEDGLSNNTLYAVYEDNSENLWLPSNYGLMRFNKTTKSVHAYLPENGIAHEEFNAFAHFQDNDGTLYLGGLSGVTVFNPNEMFNEDKLKVPFLISRIRILDEKGKSFINVTQDFIKSKKIILKPSHNILEIEANLLDFEQPDESQYSYKLEGLQEQWVYTKHNRFVFNKLPYGEYTIKIKGKGLVSGYAGEVLEIPVNVKKPFYLTWQFFFATTLVIFLSAYFFYYWRVYKLQKDRARLENKVKSRTIQIEKDKLIIEKQAEDLKELDRAKTRFFSNITHEFRTPLTLIIGPLEQLIEEHSLSMVYKRRMQGVVKNANHILNLINQLLDLSKIEGGQMKLELGQGDIVSHTNGIVKRFESLVEQKDHRLVFVSNKKAWNILFDFVKWEKIVLNLLSNAFKFTPGGGSIQVSLASVNAENKTCVKLNVSDTGIGIKESNLDRIFDRFYQVDSTSDSNLEGTGIGLSLVKELVILQGGNIKVLSVEGKGTTFEIKIPVVENDLVLSSSIISKEKEQGSTVTETERDQKAPAQYGLEIENLEILIVEDNVEMREYIRQCLKNPHHTIIEATHGMEGLQKAESIIPDLIVSDVMMPKMDGFELIQSIRKNTSTSHIPFILLTAKSSLESKLKGLERGADAYLTKPFSPLELQLTVRNLIHIRSNYQKKYLNKNRSDIDTGYKQEDEFISKLRNYILDNISEPNLNGDHIGKNFGLSRVHLYRKLKALTNTSITDFVKQVRLEKALELLQEGHLNISEVSDITGFKTTSHFSSSFKKAFGKPPSKL